MNKKQTKYLFNIYDEIKEKGSPISEANNKNQILQEITDAINQYNGKYNSIIIRPEQFTINIYGFIKEEEEEKEIITKEKIKYKISEKDIKYNKELKIFTVQKENAKKEFEINTKE